MLGYITSYITGFFRTLDESIVGYPLFRIICKLKATEAALKTWVSSNQFNTRRKHIDTIRKKLDSLWQQVDSNLLDPNIHKEEITLTSQLEH